MDEIEGGSGPASRRRRRRRPVAKPAPPQSAQPPKTRVDRAAHAARDLAGTGNSQLDPTRAARARDVNRPSAADLAAAENEVVIVRRNWKP